MNFATLILAPNQAAARAFDFAQPVFALALRWYVSWQFLKSGLLKLQSWEQTLWLFENEYRTPLLPPMAAAVLGVLGELVFPILLIVGLASRLSAAGLFAVNAGLFLPAYLGPDDGARLRMLRLARAAAIALPAVALLYEGLAARAADKRLARTGRVLLWSGVIVCGRMITFYTR